MAINKKTIMLNENMEPFIKKDYLDRSFIHSGLCAYCARRESCSLSGSFGLIYDCDEYLPGDEASCDLHVSRLKEVPDTDDCHGLCVHCQNRDFCSLKNINGGVWHCEEYI
ncbi:MAG: hypothetical protein PHO35_04980 [Candidatus Cloacimonetes bacterium]|jgi:hypothetical protein|nr:hypothetical protein [Candidatus Cloacimonadota bacterium]MDD4806118.1 hypothetical protein [Candidatus Cloacimonadota bacterium]